MPVEDSEDDVYEKEYAKDDPIDITSDRNSLFKW